MSYNVISGHVVVNGTSYRDDEILTITEKQLRYNKEWMYGDEIDGYLTVELPNKTLRTFSGVKGLNNALKYVAEEGVKTGEFDG